MRPGIYKINEVEAFTDSHAADELEGCNGVELVMATDALPELADFGGEIFQVRSEQSPEAQNVFVIMNQGVIIAVVVKSDDGLIVIPRELPGEKLDSRETAKRVSWVFWAVVEGNKKGTNLRSAIRGMEWEFGHYKALTNLDRLPSPDAPAPIYAVKSRFKAFDTNLAAENDGPGKAKYRDMVDRWIAGGLQLVGAQGEMAGAGESRTGAYVAAAGARPGNAASLPENHRKVVFFPGMSDREPAIWRGHGFKEGDMMMIEADLERARAIGRKYPEATVIQRSFHKQIKYVMREILAGLSGDQRIFAANLDPENRLTTDFQDAMERFLREAPLADKALLGVNFLVSGRGGVSGDHKMAKRIGPWNELYDLLSSKRTRINIVQKCIQAAVHAAASQYRVEDFEIMEYEGNTNASAMMANLAYLIKK